MTDEPSQFHPTAPDFDALEANLSKSAEQRAAVMSHIGNLLVNWGNNEGLMTILLQYLLESTFPTAQIVFASLATTRSRVDLIKRLAIQNTEGDMRDKLLDLCKRFSGLTRVRNEIAHSMWQFDPDGYISGSYNIRIDQNFTQNNIMETKAMSQARLNEIHYAAKQLVLFNREIYAFFHELREYMKQPPSERLEKHGPPRP